MRMFLREDVLGGLGAEDMASLSKTLKEREAKRRKQFEEQMKGPALSGQVVEPDEGSFGGIAPPQAPGPMPGPPPSFGRSDDAFRVQQDAVERVAQAAGALGQVQAPVPQRRELNDTMLGGSALADALRDIVSTRPAKDRNFVPTAQRYNDVETQRLGEEMQKGQIEAENLRNRLGANLTAEQARLQGALSGTEFAVGQEDRGEAEKWRRLGFERGAYESDRDYSLRVSEIGRMSDQWAQEFGLRKDEFDFAKLPQAAKAAMEAEEFVRQGYAPEEANRMAFGRWLVDAAQAEWLPKTLEQQFGVGKAQLESLTEELSQLKTKGKFLEPALQQELAAGALQMANTRQIMGARSEEIARARAAGDVRTLTLLETKQIADHDAQIAAYTKAIEGVRAQIAKYPTGENRAARNGLIERYKALIEKETEARDKILK